ncbi:2'-5' RNA ligase family protein [Longimicrobium sp.]|uniref:2'-5' RNA ligase family protein n=1 Tax=Longimicrobium sp. TaxID=2029185 RepID=UPI002EDAE577
MSDSPKYTTAIIAAVPAKADPVNDVVIEDAHVTLQFLGEADSLSPEQIKDIQDALALMAPNLYPFPADVAGTAELGPDKAKVLLVQSEPLTKLKELLGTVPAVSTAVAAAEQFPNWIPHLTLAYGDDGTQADGDGIEQVTIGSLELWLAEEHHVYELAKSAPGPVEEDSEVASVIAAGLKSFEEGLHPRAADGRFIDKFGVVKYLSPKGGWEYGKVEGINKDEDSGAIQVTVTPSDLSGKITGAESKVLSPKQLYHAPKAKAHLTIAAPGSKKVGGQGGSNPGGLYTIPVAFPKEGSNGQPEKYYVKQPKTKSHGANEALANDLYAEAGVPVPEVDIGSDGQIYSKIIEGKQDMAAQLNNPEWTDQIQRNFAVDAWLGNRDVFGMTYDNVLTDEHGTAWRIDNGGALLYRAMGEKKTDFGSQVTELDAFRQGKKAKIFGPSMTKAQELDGAERVVAISPSRIEEMVADAGLPKSLADTLKARRQYIANYYGLELPETKKADEAQEGSSAPLVDPADISATKGKARGWFKTTLAQAAFVLQTGDKVEFGDGKRVDPGVDDDGSPLSMIGAAAQLLGWQNEHGANAEIFVYKGKVTAGIPRPSHGQKLATADLADQRWQRGDTITSPLGNDAKILGWNSDTGAVLIQYPNQQPQLLDSKGTNANAGPWTVKRWDPPAQEDLDLSAPESATPEAQAPAPAPTPMVEDVPAPDTVPPTAEDLGIVIPTPGKTGQAAEAETAIKADLDQPLPAGTGAPAPAKTSAKGGAKTMVLGDGTEAAPGAEVVSKKDGKTYKFVKPKGQYSVVTDPNGDDPDKLLLKLASTMTQPGKEPTADAGAIEAPKTATGEIPALGMMAVSKDGHAGEITLISPDGKFVFITDANGVRKRKSTGTVTITSAPQAVDTTPKAAPGPLKDYGAAPDLKAAKEAFPGLDYDPAEDLDAGDMVIVGYADGSFGKEPYTGQPLDSLLQNTGGKVANHGTVKDYTGPISTQQLVQASAVKNNSTTFEVVWGGTIGFTDGTVGPSGGLVIWGVENGMPDPGYAFELPKEGQNVHILGSEENFALALPGGTGFQANDGWTGTASPAPLYGDEAKTPAEWSGQISVGQEISLDGQNWLTVTNVMASDSLQVEDSNGATAYLASSSPATYVLKAPPMKDADAPSPAFDPANDTTPDIPGADETTTTGPPTKKPSELVSGDVVVAFDGTYAIIEQAEKEDGFGGWNLTSLGTFETEWAPSSADLKYQGNIKAGSVDVPIGAFAGQFYPGVNFQPGPDHDMTVVSYPSLQDNGNQKFAVMINGDPENLAIVQVGPGAGADIGPDAVMGVYLAPFQTSAESGVDTGKVNDLFDASVTVDQTPPDHYWAMSDQGIDFGNAQYPIYASGSGGYYRIGPNGGQVWNAAQLEWESSSTTVTGMDKVWDGKPFEGKLKIPEGTSLSLYGAGSADYKPDAGEAVALITLPGTSGALIVSPSGSFSPGSKVYTVKGDGSGVYSPGYNVEDLGPGQITVIHDPFGPVDTGPALVHHQGPLAPTFLANKLNDYGYTPADGETFLIAQMPSGGMSVLTKQSDGTYKKIGYSGLGQKTWTLDEVIEQGNDVGADFYTWTHVPEGENGPTVVAGLPGDYAPFIPGEGQAVLKSTMPNGKVSIYLQQQPGGGWYLMSPDGTIDESSDAIKSNHVVQMKLSGKGSSSQKYELLHPTEGGTKATPDAPPTFSNQSTSFTPAPGQKVVQLLSYEGDDDPWFFVQSTPGGEWAPAPTNPEAGAPLGDSGMQAYLAKSLAAQPGAAGSKYTLVYDGTGSAAAPAVDTEDTPTPDFEGYIPQTGDKVISYAPNGTTDPYFYVQQGGEGPYKMAVGGQLSSSTVMQASEIPTNLGPEFGNDFHQEWPLPETTPAAPAGGGVFDGYQSDPGDNVVSFTGPTGGTTTVVKKDGTWQPIVNGQLEADDAYSQDTMEWAASQSGYTVNVLQGSLKGVPGEGAPLDTGGEHYAGVSVATTLSKDAVTTQDASQLSPTAMDKLDGLKLAVGQSAWVAGNSVFVRNSTGEWFYAYTDGSLDLAPTFSDDADMAAFFGNTTAPAPVKVIVTAPTAAPAPPAANLYAGPAISGWAAEGLPDPTGFGHLASSADAVGMKAGDWLYVQGLTGGGNSGLFIQLHSDVDPATGGDVVKLSQWAAVKDGQVQPIKKPSGTLDFTSFSLVAADSIYAQGSAGTAPAPTVPATPTANAPIASVPSAPEAPATPAYPGAQKPSQEDINAWGGSLTKDGHIPTSGMYVTGKGPMSGKVISVSKDKTKAVVLTSDGKKTTRLIEALKTDKSANYKAYAAPVTLKDIPGGMPLAVDTPGEALAKTAKDGKFRAILTAAPGVSGGQMVVTKTTGPSGKTYNRVHLTLTPAQREQLVASLAGSGEKGDWVTSSKMSQAVAAGDLLPMRKSSTDNPDGTPRWKVDPAQVPPTHEVTGVVDDPAASGVKIVTLKDRNTGEEITSRFHPGKSLTVYAWDENKPKKITAGAFSVGEIAKAQGWSLVTDGGISAVKGGAENGSLYNEPGSAVTKSALGQVSHSWKTLRNVSEDGVVIETVDPKGSNGHSTTGVTVITLPEGVDEKSLGAALAKMGIDYSPMTQDSAKDNVRGALRTLLSLDTHDVDTPKHYTDEMLFSQAGKTMGITDLGWQDVLVGVDESTGKTSFFWSDRARNALAAKAKYNLVYRAATTANAAQIVSTVKYGSASSILKKTTGMLDGSGSVGNGASASSDNANHAGHGSYASASTVNKLPSSNASASYKTAGMMIYHRPEAVLGRIMDFRVANHDAFGMGHGQGADHLAHATSMSSVKDYFLGGGLPTEAVGFIAVQSAEERLKAIEQLKKDGFEMINGRPIEDIVITKQKAATMTPDDLPPVTIPANARPILDLPVSYDTAAPAASAPAAAAPVTATAGDAVA